MCTCVLNYLYVCFFFLRSVSRSCICETQMQLVGTGSNGKWQHKPTKEARWLLCLWAVVVIYMCEFPIVKQGDHACNKK